MVCQKWIVGILRLRLIASNLQFQINNQSVANLIFDKLALRALALRILTAFPCYTFYQKIQTCECSQFF